MKRWYARCKIAFARRMYPHKFWEYVLAVHDNYGYKCTCANKPFEYEAFDPGYFEVLGCMWRGKAIRGMVAYLFEMR